LITFFFLGLDLGLSLPATAFLHSSRLRSFGSLSPKTFLIVTLNEALTLIKAKEKFDAERIIKTFDDSEIQVLNGRFGPYIWNGKKKGKGNFRLKLVFFEICYCTPQKEVNKDLNS
jgi:hypothetical protein